MARVTIKSLGIIALSPLLGTQLNAQTVTDPVGVVKITVAPAPSAGQTKLTAISATLRGAIAYQASATSIGAYNADAGSTPPNPDQTLTQTGAGWTTNQWTTEPHLCYIENASGAEEAYLIKSHTADTLTLATSFDFSSRYTSTPTFRICKANTLGSLFGTTSLDVPFKQHINVNQADNIYIWNGTLWDTYWFTGSVWLSTAIPTSANNVVVFPDEGIFVLRRDTSSINLTFNGSVPTKKQVSTVAGTGLTFLSTRYPVDTTVSNLGLASLPNWTTANDSSAADRFYVWNGSTWDFYWNNGAVWLSSAIPTAADNVIIPADSAIFVLRVSSASEAQSPNVHDLPYTP